MTGLKMGMLGIQRKKFAPHLSASRGKDSPACMKQKSYLVVWETFESDVEFGMLVVLCKMYGHTSRGHFGSS